MRPLNNNFDLGAKNMSKPIWLLISLIATLSPGLIAQSSTPKTLYSWQYGWPLALDRETRHLWEEGVDIKGQIFRRSRSVRWEEGPLALGWGDIWGIRPSTTGPHTLLRSTDGLKWETMGLIEGDLPAQFMPLGTDRFIAVVRGTAHGSYFEVGKEASPVAIFKRQGGSTFRLERAVPLIDGGLLEQVGGAASSLDGAPRGSLQSANSSARSTGDSETKAGMSNPPVWKKRKGFSAFLFNLSDSIMWVPLPTGGALLHLSTGHIWVFGNNGELRHHVAVFDAYKESDFLRLIDLPRVCLGAVPTAEGHILLATRSKAGVFEAAEKYPTMDWDPATGRLTPKPDLDLVANHQRMRRLDYPEIFWWDFDPVEGKFSRMEVPPMGAPERRPMEEAQDISMEESGMKFRLTLNGGVVVEQ